MSHVLKTVCNRDCPDACTISVTIEGDRAVRLTGDKADPVTQGFLCERTRRFLDRQYAADRFLEPMLRKGGKLVPISWESALDLAAEKLKKARELDGPASILHYRSGGSLGILKLATELLFSNFGPVTTKRGDICSGAGEAAQLADFGICESHDLHDLLNAKLIVLWGKNPHTSGVHLLPVLKEAKKRGAKLIAIDPVKTRAASVADDFLTPRPGADSALAFGAARWLFEQELHDPKAHEYCDNLDDFRVMVFSRDLDAYAKMADVPRAQIEGLASAIAEHKPAAFLVGWGLGRRANGTATVRAIDALGAISGNLGVPGGGVSYYFGRRTAFDAEFGAEVLPPARTFAEALLGQEILAARSPKVRVIWVTAGNPVSMLPDSEVVKEAFEKTDFKIVVDTHPTDTTDLADLVLPTLTLLEDDDLLGAYGNHYLRASKPALSPAGKTRHELHILQELAQRLGLGELMSGTVDEWKRRAMSRLRDAEVTLEQLQRAPVRNPFAARVLFEDRKFLTPSGRVNLMTEPPAPLEPPGDYPLRLLAVSTPKAQSSQQSAPLPDGPPCVRVHPGAAGDFKDGEVAALESRRGVLRVKVRHDARVRRDIAWMDKGGMMRQGRCINALVRARETDDGGGAAYYDEPVRLIRV